MQKYIIKVSSQLFHILYCTQFVIFRGRLDRRHLFETYTLVLLKIRLYRESSNLDPALALDIICLWTFRQKDL